MLRLRPNFAAANYNDILLYRVINVIHVINYNQSPDLPVIWNPIILNIFQFHIKWFRKRKLLFPILSCLLAKIKCSICSFQSNIWNVAHCATFDIKRIFVIGNWVPWLANTQFRSVPSIALSLGDAHILELLAGWDMWDIGKVISEKKIID